jgi:hypothetical protein
MLFTWVNFKNPYFISLHVEFTYEEYTNTYVQNVGPPAITHLWLLNEKFNNMDKKIFLNLSLNQSQWG